MKRAGEYLGAIIDAKLYSKAKAYSGFFTSWDQITYGCGLAAAGGHSRVRELEKGILVVEADHPGWVQILQTKAPQIIGAVRRRFPELDVRGISFTLSKPPGPGAGEEDPPEEAPVREDEESGEIAGTAGTTGTGETAETPSNKTWEQLGESDLKDSLKRLEQSIRARERSAARRSRGKK
jgi:hypothetical protein